MNPEEMMKMLGEEGVPLEAGMTEGMQQAQFKAIKEHFSKDSKEALEEIGIAQKDDAGDIEDEDMEIVENEDGSVTVVEKEQPGPLGDEEFYGNLAESWDEMELMELGTKYVELVSKDKRSREERDKKYEEGLRRTGLGGDAPGGANFPGASRVVHPGLTKLCIDFCAKAIKEILPPEGPVKTYIFGEANQLKEQKAEKKRVFMNWQLTDQIEEYRDELESMLTQLPMGGSQYTAWSFDEEEGKPCYEFVPIDDIILPASAANIYKTPRFAWVHHITEEKFRTRIEMGIYRDMELMTPSMADDESAAKGANDRIEGKDDDDNVDGVRDVYHIYTYLMLDDDSYSKGKRAPYILMVDKETEDVVGLYRNWEKEDKRMRKLDWVTEWRFIPWRGAYGIGAPHIMGGLSAAATGSLRGLLDAANIANSQTVLKAKGARQSGQSLHLQPTQIGEIDLQGGDDIRKVILPFEFPGPNQVLLQLLGLLGKEIDGLIATSEEKLDQAAPTAPVGTAQALIEQGSKVYSAIHARLHASQRRSLEILQRLNRWYLMDMPDAEDKVEELELRTSMFASTTDIIPISDPNIFSETQRMAQMQGVLQLATTVAPVAPGLINMEEAVSRMIKQMRIPDADKLLNKKSIPREMNAAMENSAMTLGKATQAFQHQDHLAHIQTHLSYAQDPQFGKNPIIASTFTPLALEHIKQHLVMFYIQSMGYHSEMGVDGIQNEKVGGREQDQIIAAASRHAGLDSDEVIKGAMPILGEMMKQVQQMKQGSMPQDPASQALIQTTQMELQAKQQMEQMKLQTQQAIEQMKLDFAREKAEMESQLKAAIAQSQTGSKERIEAAKMAHDDQKMDKQHGQAQDAAMNQHAMNEYSANEEFKRGGEVHKRDIEKMAAQHHFGSQMEGMKHQNAMAGRKADQEHQRGMEERKMAHGAEQEHRKMQHAADREDQKMLADAAMTDINHSRDMEKAQFQRDQGLESTALNNMHALELDERKANQAKLDRQHKTNSEKSKMEHDAGQSKLDRQHQTNSSKMTHEQGKESTSMQQAFEMAKMDKQAKMQANKPKPTGGKNGRQ